MPHIAVTMFSGRDEAAKINLALAVREAVSKELGIGPECVSVSVEDIDGTLGRGDAANPRRNDVCGAGRAERPGRCKRRKTNMKRILIAYYSHSGNTEELAELIRTETGGTLFEIKPVHPYPSAYQAVVDQAKEEIRAGFRPEIRETVDMGPYDIVFVGSPNWWSTIAPPVASFLERCDLTGKTVVPFCTHGGGGMAGLARDTQALCPDSEAANGFAAYGNSGQRVRDEVDAWLRGIGVKE